MIGNCDCCEGMGIPVIKTVAFGIETTACFLCQGDTNPDPYAEMDHPEPYSQLLSSWAECRRLLSEERKESERLRGLLNTRFINCEAWTSSEANENG